MNKIFKIKNFVKLAIIFTLFLILVMPSFVFATSHLSPFNNPSSNSYQNLFEPTGLVGSSATTARSCSATINGIGDFLCRISEILNSVIPVLVALGVVYFVWGVVTYIIGGDEESKKKGREKVVYGIIGLTVIVGLWGLVYILVNTFGLGVSSAPSLVPLAGEGSSCGLSGNPKFQDLACYITRIINDSVIPLIFALASAMFVWGVVQYVINSDEEAKKEKGRQFMIWGIIALAVMVSVWGLVAILGGTFGLDTSVLPQVKQ